MRSLCLSLLERAAAWSYGRKIGLAFVLGVLAALAFAPFGIVPVLFVVFPLFYGLLASVNTKKAAFGIGWFFAFGQFLVCLHWIAASLIIVIWEYWALFPFAIIGFPIVFGCFYALGALGAYVYGLRKYDGVLFFALCWFGAEMARSHMFTGLPWDLLGYVWSNCLPVLQAVSLFGIEGLSFLTLLAALAPVFLFLPPQRKSGIVLAVLPFALLASFAAWGHVRLESQPTRMTEKVRLRLVQPNQVPSIRWTEEQRLFNFQNLMAASFDAELAGVTHVVWPEAAGVYFLAEEAGPRLRIAERLPKGGSLITGAVRRERKEDGKWRYYNSMLAVNDRGDVVMGYDKHHLVPFGEYVPFRHLLPMKAVAGLGTDFSAGETIRTARVAGLPPFGALICYEAIFSGEVVEKNDPPAFLLNVTNDVWYRGTIGPLQHFEIVRVRAVEEGVPLVRVANKGITGIVDPVGRVTARLDISKDKGFLDADLPLPLPEKTVFRAYGRIFLWLMLASALFLTFFLRLIGGRRRRI